MVDESWIRLSVEFLLYQHRFCSSIVGGYEDLEDLVSA
jgi:hypothetical protein